MSAHGAGLDPPHRTEVVLLGAMCVGKSTVARLLAARLGVPYRSTDAMWGEHATRFGLDRAHAQSLWERGAYDVLYTYGKPFEVLLLEALPVEPGVVEVGSTFTVQEDPGLRKRCLAALRRHSHVVHLVASPDAAEGETILYARLRARSEARVPAPAELSLWRRSLDQRISVEAATHTVHTGDCTAAEAVQRLQSAVLLPTDSDESPAHQ